MKKNGDERTRTAKENLEIAVKQYFIRLHEPIFNEIFKSANQLEHPENALYDENNIHHKELVSLCKKLLGYKIVALDRDIFFLY